jgi:solute carrier family 24 (sodium/potassium/calcium exchanger), member 6
MSTLKRRWGARNARPFSVSVLLITVLAAFSFLFRTQINSPHALTSIYRRGKETEECRAVHYAKDQCAFVRANCLDDEAGLFSYLTLYYCNLGGAQPVAFTILILWLGLLFTTIGIAASDFFSINLSTIASILGLSESLAGVTFLAFGNGSPDVFSTFAAMGSNSASMAVGELIGAACFITAVVAGSMALVREFKVGRKAYVRDICFFIGAVCFTMVFLRDGQLRFWECCVMIGYYVVYVVVVVGWHWYSTRRRARHAREAAARGHVYGAVSQSNDELAPAPYRDDPEDGETDRQISSRGATNGGDFSALEEGPRIELDGHRVTGDDDEDEDSEEHGRHVANEMASSMRVLRPRGKRRTTITPIRPSLVGALEFRAALAHLQREGNLRLSTMQSRSYSAQNLTRTRAQRGATTSASVERMGQPVPPIQASGPNRERALSHNDIPDSLRRDPPQLLVELGDSSPTGLPSPSGKLTGQRTPSPSPSFTIGGSLAPPQTAQQLLLPDYSEQLGGQTVLKLSPGSLQLHIPSPGTSVSGQSSPITPFPGYTDSPMPMTPNPQVESPTFILPPGPGRLESSFPDFNIHQDHGRPVRWWPYSILPPPHILQNTLFPTIQGWQQKGLWDKFVSAICIPSIFLLVITLPVVEADAGDNESDATTINEAEPTSNSEIVNPSSISGNNLTGTETEWQRYRRTTRSHDEQPPSLHMSPTLIAIDSPGNTRQTIPTDLDTPQGPFPKPVSGQPSESDTPASDPMSGWNRWLVALQLFTGPQFAILILWANMQEDLDQPGKVLVRFILWTLVVSLVLLAILLLTTSPDRRPKYHFLLCFLGFLISIAWISTIAGEVVGVLKALGVILGISEALLGLTIFAAGNSVGDLIADITVARLGYPVMAL